MIRKKLLPTICAALFAAGVAGAQEQRLYANRYDPEADKLYAEKVTVYDPVERWTYCHHPSMAVYNGRFYVIFSNGPAGEDEPGQRILLTTSDDFTEWTEPTVLLEPEMGAYGQPKILTPGGITVLDDRLVLYYTVNDNDGETNKRIDPVLYAVTSEDGWTWSEPVNLKMRVFPCHRPLTLSTGRIVLTGNTLFYYTDDPSGVGRIWHRGRYVASGTEGEEPYLTVRPSLCEGALVEHNDGTLYCLFRSTGRNYDGYLWQSESRNGGADWTYPVKSRFTDNNTKSFFGNLPDGRYFYVGTPDKSAPGTRWPLVLAVSEDGFDFDKSWILSDDHYTQLYAGRWKGGDYGYPYALVHDGYVYVVLSRHKERIEMLRIEIDELQ